MTERIKSTLSRYRAGRFMDDKEAGLLLEVAADVERSGIEEDEVFLRELFFVFSQSYFWTSEEYEEFEQFFKIS